MLFRTLELFVSRQVFFDKNFNLSYDALPFGLAFIPQSRNVA